MVDAVIEIEKLSERVELAIDGRLYGGWTDVSIAGSLDQLTATFTLTLAAKERAADVEFPIRAGDACEVRIAGDTVITGWIDAVAPSGGAEAHQIAVTGRDRTGDLADCSAIHKPGSWRNVRIEQIAAELAKPLGITVTARTSTGAALGRFALQQGETTQAAIERLLRFRGLLMTTTAAGDLEIITPDSGAPIATLEYGVNILTWSAAHDQSQRFSDYVVKGQAAGNDDKNGKTVAQVNGSATDTGMRRYRPLLIVAEEQSDGASAKTRAAWEAGVRAGKSVSAELTVLGWRPAPGAALWRTNTTVRVKCAPAQLADRLMLITGVAFSKSDNGTTTTLTVMPPQAWKQLAEPEPVEKAKKPVKKVAKK